MLGIIACPVEDRRSRDQDRRHTFRRRHGRSRRRLMRGTNRTAVSIVGDGVRDFMDAARRRPATYGYMLEGGASPGSVMASAARRS